MELLFLYVVCIFHLHLYVCLRGRIPVLSLLTYLLTPWSTVLLEQLTGFQTVKKFSEFNGTRRFITAFTSAGHLSLS